MNKEKFKLIFEIVFLSIFIVVTYFYWDNLDFMKYASVAAGAYDESTLSIEETSSVSKGVLTPTTDAVALSRESGEVVVTNASYDNKYYTLVFAVSKSSTLDYNYLSVSVGNEIFKLKDVETLEDEEYIYFLLNNFTVEGVNTHNLRIWLNEETTKEHMGKSFSYLVSLIENYEEVAMN